MCVYIHIGITKHPSGHSSPGGDEQLGHYAIGCKKTLRFHECKGL